jgi:hypothetical protein
MNTVELVVDRRWANKLLQKIPYHVCKLSESVINVCDKHCIEITFFTATDKSITIEDRTMLPSMIVPLIDRPFENLMLSAPIYIEQYIIRIDGLNHYYMPDILMDCITYPTIKRIYYSTCFVDEILKINGKVIKTYATVYMPCILSRS